MAQKEVNTYLKVFLILLLGNKISGAKILALMVVASHSHHLWNVKYLTALARRGHEITYVGVDEYKNPPENIRYILIEGIYDEYESENLAGISELGPYYSIYYIYRWQEMEAPVHLRSEGLRTLKKVLRSERFDLVVNDVTSSPFLLGAVDVLGRPPLVGITAFGVPTWTLETLGNPVTYSAEPHFSSPYSNRMSIYQRADNYFLHLFSYAVTWFHVRRQNGHSIEVFGKDIRPLDQIIDDANIIMVNSNYGLDYPFSKVPGLIPVGGLHIEEPKALPEELRSYLDESKEGVVYFSLGTNIQSSQLKDDKIRILAKAFGELAPVRILWKWEADSFPEKPDNVRVAKWLPQNDVLAHPNVRVFFTHSGLLSTQEAIYHGKPMVGMPFFLDQHVNVKKCAERGLAEHLDFASLTADKVVEAVTKVLSDPRFGERARNASSLFRDEMTHPLQRAVYWTEYAIRHKGAPHLRHSSRDLSWLQNSLLDVALLAFLLALSFFLLIQSLWKTLVSIFSSNLESKLKAH